MSNILLNPPLCTIIPSPTDTRDWKAESIYQAETTVPARLNLTNHLPPVRNQGNQGTCAAQSAACMKEWQEHLESDFNEHMSPQYIYNLRENQLSEGMYCRDVMRILQTYGVCPDKQYPYGIVESPDAIPNDVTTVAKRYTIKSYASISTVMSLKKALWRNGPCLIAFPVYHYGIDMWNQTKPGQVAQGGHAMAVVGYTTTHFIIRNSWGPAWGENGYCNYPFTEWGSHWEVWTTIDDLSVSPPSSPPIPADPTTDSTVTSWSECLRRYLVKFNIGHKPG